ncbi:unnamed protein product [Adineta ricciae]|uniref:G-protein coupled receptors family 1 profile domain-containing protein n=1 Tax=Adineta ricciae TaxID=249248 RepID=A0A813RT86_ADIRI|nr:unnamed protein product [Adineta ricciae]CAF0785284.1 unnamed protein product [Adineta ricciae]
MSTIDGIRYATLQVNRYVSIILLLLGTISNLLCCLVFTQRTLRSNPCALYFLVVNISNIISLTAGIPPRMLNSWNILADQTETISSLCKIRLLVVLASRNISSWLLVCAAIDRCFLSSSKADTRRRSNRKQAVRLIIIVSIMSLAFWTECLYCFDANLIGTPLRCYAKSANCRIFNDLAQVFVTTMIPSTIMMIAGLYTIKNIRQARRILPATVNPILSRGRKTESNLTKMLFLQVIFLTIFNLPQAIQKFYLTYTFYDSRSLLQTTIENLLFNIVLLLTYVSSCVPFCLYILTGDVFRMKLVRIIRTIVHYVKC